MAKKSDLAKKFAKEWIKTLDEHRQISGKKADEEKFSQKFWLGLLRDVFGVYDDNYIDFEKKVNIEGNEKSIDGYICNTGVLIEQKSTKVNFDNDKNFEKTYLQALAYAKSLNMTDFKVNWIIICNFNEFWIYDAKTMEKSKTPKEKLLLTDLDKHYYLLEILVDTSKEDLKKEMEISLKAGEIIGTIYDAVLNQYIDPKNLKSLESLNIFCVRLVFCLYAEDSDLFGEHGMFHDYIKSFPVKYVRRAIIELFKVLNQTEKERDPYEDQKLLEFPYVNGGLFFNNDIEIPYITEEIVNIILKNASEDFDWSEISPTIFGAVFESTLNPKTRHDGGMHYTSIENIHKVIAPLFLNELNKEFEEINSLKTKEIRYKKLKQLHKKLSTLTFLDPACGSGNFLTETYICLRKLENKILDYLHVNGQSALNLGEDELLIQVNISQFYGIEVNDFAVTVARTALWIAEAQMKKETEKILGLDLDFLPLKTSATIVHGNALTLDWSEVIPNDKLSYIMGNPPFLGARVMDQNQKNDLEISMGKVKGFSNLDYVCGWYKKACQFIDKTNIECAFVSTNSITQGEQAPMLWRYLVENGIKINFAYKTFKWNSEASNKAAVHCVIIGFSKLDKCYGVYFDDNSFLPCKNINPYLIDASNVFIDNRSEPLCNVNSMCFGSMPNDSGALSNFSEDDKNEIIQNYPQSKDIFRVFLGSREFINNEKRYCLWIDDSNLHLVNKIKPVKDALEKVKNSRETSSREATKKLAKYPYLFGEIRQPDTDYLLVPSTSSENREYIPMGFISKDVISSNANLLIPNATLYEFGVLTSCTHMAWVRAVCGRLKSDYRYSAQIVYNNFPWCTPTDKQKAKIEKTAQAILDARALYPDSSLADLYNELTMPEKLRKAHDANDEAVRQAYGFDKSITEPDCVAKLMEMYLDITTKL